MPKEIILTRYLYSKSGVLNSLENSVLKNQYEESLFWAYEIYFSGFEEEIIEFLFGMIERYYKNFPKLTNFLKKKGKEKKDETIGTIIKNLCLRNHLSVEGTNRQVYVVIKNDGIEYLRTNEISPCWKIVKTRCIYDGIKGVEFNGLLETFRDDWLFYASFSPIWEKRILENNGIIELENRSVVFKNDNDLENFYNKYGYEPDEQPLEIQKRCLFI